MEKIKYLYLSTMETFNHNHNFYKPLNEIENEIYTIKLV